MLLILACTTLHTVSGEDMSAVPIVTVVNLLGYSVPESAGSTGRVQKHHGHHESLHKRRCFTVSRGKASRSGAVKCEISHTLTQCQ
jgi:hypothetical protein